MGHRHAGHAGEEEEEAESGRSGADNLFHCNNKQNAFFYLLKMHIVKEKTHFAQKICVGLKSTLNGNENDNSIHENSILSNRHD